MVPANGIGGGMLPPDYPLITPLVFDVQTVQYEKPLFGNGKDWAEAMIGQLGAEYHLRHK